MTKILFSTPTQPYPTQFCNDSLTDLTSQRLTKGQDIFTPRISLCLQSFWSIRPNKVLRMK
jgi:hypothetical protein